MRSVLAAIANPDFKNQIVLEDGYNSDIIKTLNSRFSLAAHQTKGAKFSGSTLLEKGRAIYNYLRHNVRYQKDPSGKQIIQLPSRMLKDSKSGDCKSLALASAAFMHNNGFKNVRLRYTSYDASDPTPTHVYAVGDDENGNTIIIDPVYKQFNKELKYYYKTDHPMQISVLSGIHAIPGNLVVVRNDKKIKRSPVDVARQILQSGKVSPGGVFHNVLSNYVVRMDGGSFPRYSSEQLKKYQKMLIARAGAKNPFLRGLIANEINLIQSGTFTGNVISERSQSIQGVREEIGRISLKKITSKIRKTAKSAGAAIKKISPKTLLKAVKTVGLVVPRKAFLALVSINVRGIASRMAQLSQSELKKVWVDKFGGKLSAINDAINRGKKKRSILGLDERVGYVSGIGYVVDDSIGVSPASAADGAGGGMDAGKSIDVASLVKVAAPIIEFFVNLLKKLGKKAPPDAAGSGVDTDFSEASGMAQDSKPGWMDYVQKGLDIVKSTGIIPDFPNTGVQQKVDEALPGDDHSGDGKTSFDVKPEVLIFGAATLAGIYFITKKGN